MSGSGDNQAILHELDDGLRRCIDEPSVVPLAELHRAMERDRTFTPEKQLPYDWKRLCTEPVAVNVGEANPLTVASWVAPLTDEDGAEQRTSSNLIKLSFRALCGPDSAMMARLATKTYASRALLIAITLDR